MSARYTIARKVVDTCTAGMLEGALLDLYTAGALVAVYEAMSEANRAKFDTIPLERLVAFCFKHTS